ncbi:hypothetical protein E2562_007505 [Oryza meyeriana var. granulata]|uniref:Uncharacterized protein n=1 Tax=Oryza meyeriana var. granulata TaxID=110450 RepID=A0A6G1DWB5_9ORYZ|nr:hypothetical protein E2562_007505 [Oryza meyeriana var. granulata]
MTGARMHVTVVRALAGSPRTQQCGPGIPSLLCMASGPMNYDPIRSRPFNPHDSVLIRMCRSLLLVRRQLMPAAASDMECS